MYKGTVQKTFSNAFGKSFVLQGEKGFFNHGKTDLGLSQGMYVEFLADEGKRPDAFNVRMDSFKVVTAAPVKTEDYAMGHGAKRTTVLQKDDYWNRKDERDVENDRKRNFGAARNTAIAYAELINKVEPFCTTAEVVKFIEDTTTNLASA